MAYFSEFPYVTYQFPDNIQRVYKNISIRPAIFEEVLRHSSNYEVYDVQDGETPETLAFDFYGDVNLHWTIMLANNVLNLYTDWPKTTTQFDEYMYQKYKIQPTVAGKDVELTRMETQEYIEFTGAPANLYTQNIGIKISQYVDPISESDLGVFYNPRITYKRNDSESIASFETYPQAIRDEIEQLTLFSLNYYLNKYTTRETRTNRNVTGIQYSISRLVGALGLNVFVDGDSGNFQDHIILNPNAVDSEGINQAYVIIHEVLHSALNIEGVHPNRHHDIIGYTSTNPVIVDVETAYNAFVASGRTLQQEFPYPLSTDTTHFLHVNNRHVVSRPQHFLDDVTGDQYNFDTITRQGVSYTNAFGQPVDPPIVAPISIYQHEFNLNEAARQIIILKRSTVEQLQAELRDLTHE